MVQHMDAARHQFHVLFQLPEFLAIVAFCLDVGPGTGTYVLPILSRLVNSGCNDLAGHLSEGAFAAFIVDSLRSNDELLYRRACHLVAVMSYGRDLSRFAAPMYDALHIASEVPIAYYIYYQMEYLSWDPELFATMRRLRDSANFLKVGATVISALQWAVAAGCEPVIRELVDGDWIPYFLSLTQVTHLSAKVLLGFQSLATLVPHLDFSRIDVRQILDLDLTITILDELRTEAPVVGLLQFLTALMAYAPYSVIPMILESSDGRLGVLDRIMRLGSCDSFAVGEAMLAALVALIRKASTAQIMQIPFTIVLPRIFELVTSVDEVHCLDVVQCLKVVVDANEAFNGPYDMQELFCAYGAEEMFEHIGGLGHLQLQEQAAVLHSAVFGDDWRPSNRPGVLGLGMRRGPMVKGPQGSRDAAGFTAEDVWEWPYEH
jgi:hypothetical protein